MLDSAVAKVARVARKGNTVLRGEEGTVHKGLSNKEVLRHFRLSSAATELVIRRLKWMQQMARHPAEHNLVLCSMLGTCQGELAAGCSPCVQDDVISNEQGTNPWALQAVRDLLLL